MIEKPLLARLKTVLANVFVDVTPQKDYPAPFAVLSILGGGEVQRAGLTNESRFQVSIYAKTRDSRATQTADVQAALFGWTDTANGICGVVTQTPANEYTYPTDKGPEGLYTAVIEGTAFHT